MYEQFAPFYDRVEGDTAAVFARWITSRSERYLGSVGSLLELGCGTGAVLEALPSAWTKTGVDISPTMLALAREKGISAELVLGDMTSVHLDARFDIAVCVFDTVNHLSGALAWGRAFAVAHEHVRPHGLYLFDVNTLGRLHQAAAEPAWVHDFDGNTLIVKISDAGHGTFDWDLRVFERDGHLYRLRHDVVRETALLLDETRALLAGAGFEVLECADGAGQAASEESRRAFFVCRRL